MSSEFKQIAVSGYELLFNFEFSEDGRLGYSIGVRTSSPRPMTIVGVYAQRLHGLPIMDFMMGGINQPWEPQPPPHTIPVFIISDSEDFFGHECPMCAGYFRNRHHSAVCDITCPYCGFRGRAYRFLSSAYRRYIADFVSHLEALEHQVFEDGEAREVAVSIDHVAEAVNQDELPAFFHATESQQTKIRCEDCGDCTDILGKFGYCATCGRRNNFEILQDSMKSIREQMNNDSLPPNAALREAVSILDGVVKDYLSQVIARVPMREERKNKLRKYKFHNLSSNTIREVRDWTGIDLLRGVDDNFELAKKLMLRRHVHEHNSGVVDEKYLKLSGDAVVRLGQSLRESKYDVNQFISVLERVGRNLDDDFHALFPVCETPFHKS